MREGWGVGVGLLEEKLLLLSKNLTYYELLW